MVLPAPVSSVPQEDESRALCPPTNRTPKTYPNILPAQERPKNRWSWRRHSEVPEQAWVTPWWKRDIILPISSDLSETFCIGEGVWVNILNILPESLTVKENLEELRLLSSPYRVA
ncbi:hypothetical protein M413DRAFT_317238 [Hebeloma cylindrosporum]|uniref:Uncharacterized protein n=1 Tax=Hebeloma cylindrosporum TaxID=76867 RepID=A0A0C3CRI2_HEBCY|nr:hypothetical protein M413DRAFT_317238 [Hebeloma cylindrosporum h7]